MKSIEKPLRRVVVNADDYGRFACTSRGILDAHQRGIVSATGVMTNAPDVARQIDWLREFPALEVGVHLTASWGSPITNALASALHSSNGHFPGKGGLVRGLMSRSIPLRLIKSEWTAQVERLIELGIGPAFLNSHEHVHMFPPLYDITQEIAERFAIRFIRFTQVRVGASRGFREIVRAIALRLVSPNRQASSVIPVRLLGVVGSGRLSVAQLRAELADIGPGEVCELMCHPGYFDGEEITDKALLDYHNWTLEFETLTAWTPARLFSELGVQLTRFRDCNNSVKVQADGDAPFKAK